MNDSVDWELLAKYVAGECSDPEKAAIRSWVAVDGRRAELLDELQHVWAAMGEEEDMEVNVDDAWQTLDEKMRQEETIGPLPVSDDVSGTEAAQRGRLSGRYWWRAAAAVVVAALTTLLALLLVEQPAPESSGPQAKVFTTKKGQRAILKLTDGTSVQLNADSKLVLAAGFPADVRKVRLEGQAYFEVAQDTARPFRVQTREASVQVLGTAFDVRAYDEEPQVQVAVAEGEVALRSAQSEVRDTVMLRSRHLGTVSNRNVQAVRRNVDFGRHLAWTEGRLVFDDASFDEVARQLERWYDLRIETRLSSENIDQLNAIFRSESLNEVLSDIAVALDLQYERKRNTVTFYR